MATIGFSVTDEPTAITGLSDGQTYIAQNVGGNLVSFAEASSAPEASDAAFKRQPLESQVLKPVSGESIYVWTKAEHRSQLSISEQ